MKICEEKKLWFSKQQRSDIMQKYSNISLQLKMLFSNLITKELLSTSIFCCLEFHYSECSIPRQQILVNKIRSSYTKSCCELRSRKKKIFRTSSLLLRNYSAYTSPFLSHKILCVCVCSVGAGRLDGFS